MVRRATQPAEPIQLMHRTIYPISALLLGVTGLVMGTGILGVLLPLRGIAEGFSTFGVAAVGAAYFFGFIFGCLQTQRLVERVGHIRLFASFAALVAAAVMVHALAVNLPVWIVARAATGFCVAGLYVVIESWLNHQAARETRGRLFGLYMVVNFVGLMAGQLLMVTMEVGSVTPFLVTGLAVCLSLVPVALSRATAPNVEPTPPLGLKPLFDISPLGVAGCLLVGLANGAYWSLGAVYGSAQLGSDGLAAVFVSVFVLGGALGQVPLGRLSDRWDRRKVIVLTSAVAAAGGITLGVWPAPEFGILLVVGGLTGGFMLAIYSLCVAHANDHVDRKDFVAVSSGLLLFYAAGAISGPILAAALMAVAGPPALFFLTAAAHILLAGYALYRMRQRGPVDESARTDFVPMMRSMPVASEMDPRADTPPSAE